VKPFVVLISILLVAFFSIIYAFAQELPAHMRRDTETSQRRRERKANRDTEEAAPDANSVVDPNDPNAAKAPYQMFEGLEGELELLNLRAEKEVREWSRSKSDDRTSLAKSVNEQIVREFNFIRELAVEEGAVKTTAAIDGLMMMRQERFDRSVKDLEDIKKRIKEREERREGRDRDRERRRERMPRRREL
jgi:hypothetical protein